MALGDEVLRVEPPGWNWCSYKNRERPQSLSMVRRWLFAGLEKEPSPKPNYADTLILNLQPKDYEK